MPIPAITLFNPQPVTSLAPLVFHFCNTNDNSTVPDTTGHTWTINTCGRILLHVFVVPPMEHSFIHVFISIYSFTGATQGCADSHNTIHNMSVQIQMSLQNSVVIYNL